MKKILMLLVMAFGLAMFTGCDVRDADVASNNISQDAYCYS